MGVDDDSARGGLPENLGEAHDGCSARADDVRQHLRGSDGGQLVDIADDEQRRVIRRRLHQRLHQHDVDHGGLVDHEQIAIEGIVGVAREPAALGIDLQEPVDRLRLDARRFGHALGCATRRGAKQQSNVFGRKDLEDRIDDRRLADARPAGDHQRLGGQRQTDRCPLTLGELQTAALFDPWQGLLFVNPRPGQPAVHDADQPIGDHLLGPVEACQEDAGGVADLVGDHGALESFELEGRQNQFLRRFEQFFGEWNQLIRRQPAVTLVHRLGQGVGNPRAQSDHRCLFDAEPHRDRVGALETNAPDVPG